MSDAELLKPCDAGAEIKTSEATLASWRCRGMGPRYVKLGGKIFYRRCDLHAFIASRVIDPTAVAR